MKAKTANTTDTMERIWFMMWSEEGPWYPHGERFRSVTIDAIVTEVDGVCDRQANVVQSRNPGWGSPWVRITNTTLVFE